MEPIDFAEVERVTDRYRQVLGGLETPRRRTPRQEREGMRVVRLAAYLSDRCEREGGLALPMDDVPEYMAWWQGT